MRTWWSRHHNVWRQAEVPLTEAQVERLIRQYDTDGDDKISRKELRAILKKLGVRFAGFRAARAMAHVDANEDGVISDEEVNELAKYAVSKWGVTIT
ncbi:hypothetical protein SSX86_014053 [Deinandra increscens subsp. villosa]|uniref:EF-hand domain-containing protein n=1 Tax=Deinandra increscens subsp. villosa TaxID=3103831 RepID=A0AAP0D181_9ASTR